MDISSIEKLIESFVIAEHELSCKLDEVECSSEPPQRLKEFYPDIVQFLAYIQLRKRGESSSFVNAQDLNLRAVEIAYERDLRIVDSQTYREIFRQVYYEVGVEKVKLLLLGPEEVRGLPRLRVSVKRLTTQIDYLIGSEH